MKIKSKPKIALKLKFYENKKMKFFSLHILLTTDFPPEMGGIQRCLSNVYETFPEGSLLVITPNTKGARDFDSKQRYKIKRTGRIFRFKNKKIRNLVFILSSFFLLLFTAIKCKLKRERVVVHSGHILSGIPTYFIKKIIGIPYIQWTYAIEVMDKRRVWIIKKVLNSADFVLAVSRWVEDYLRKLVRAEKIKRIRLFLPKIKEPKRDKMEELSEIFRGKKVILTVARLARLQRYKGIDITIEAMRIIKESEPKAVYVVVGDGDFRRKYERMAEEIGLKENVIFVGMVSDDELFLYYSICDVFVMPSRVEETENGLLSEGFGLVFLEANYFGKPVIGGEGGCRDAIIDGKTGFIVNPRSPEEIAEKVLFLLKNDEIRKRMGEEGKRWAESVHAEDLRNFLLELVA